MAITDPIFPVAPPARLPTILVVEDEPLQRLVITDFLKECGFDILESANAAEAIEVLTKQTGQIDLVFSDVQMPGEIDGFGLAKWIRENRPGTPVVLASGCTGKAELARDLCAGEHFFPKPFDMDEVAAKIRETLNRKIAS